MHVLIIDGQGGGIGSQLVKAVRQAFPEVSVTAVGANSIATSAMLKGGAHEAATGENAVIVACKSTDVIIGPIGIVITDSLLGEITEAMASAVARANAVRILLPMNRCDNIVAGVKNASAGALIADAMAELGKLVNNT